MSVDELKRAAARAAIAELPATGIIGLGTGSTVACFLEALQEVIAAGRPITAVPTSEATRAQARALGIAVLADDGPWDIAVTVDGADEVDPRLDLIKGGGGAHTREKIVSFASARTIIIVDEAKLSPRLGTRCAVPIEVLAFGSRTTQAHLAAYGEPVLRPSRSDAGNLLFDLKVAPIGDPRALDRELRSIPGVVETGLFIGRADLVLVGTPDGVVRHARGAP